jgi:glycosyltransferase involved in cell wall biosynthesis
MAPTPPACLKFSVIIPTYNEERFIRRCLDSIRDQRVAADRVEIVVVDNGSTDQTLTICQEYTDRILSHPELRVGAMRNRGAASATGQVLAFLDADCIADAGWLAAADALLSEKSCVTGDSYDIPSDPHWIERAWFAQEHRGRRATHLIPAGNMIVPRELFLRLGGFNEQIVTGEDAEFCQRAAQIVPVIADDSLRVVHLGNPKTLKKFVTREMWHGMGALGSLRLNWNDKPLFGTVMFLLLTLTQIVGLTFSAMGRGSWLFWLGTAGVSLLLAATVAYRMRAIRDWRAVPSLALLYYVYYSGRSIALLMLLAGRDFRRRAK